MAEIAWIEPPFKTPCLPCRRKYGYGSHPGFGPLSDVAVLAQGIDHVMLELGQWRDPEGVPWTLWYGGWCWMHFQPSVVKMMPSLRLTVAEDGGELTPERLDAERALLALTRDTRAVIRG